VKELKTITENYLVEGGPLSLEHIGILGGANYFSGGPVVHMRLNLNQFDEVFSNQIEGFYERLAMTLPTLIEHHCSEGVRGGFFIRVNEGTLLGHVVEHVSIELQTLAGMDVSYGKTRASVVPGVYNIVFRFFDEFAGIYAGKAAVNLVNAVLRNEDFPLMDVIEKLIFIREKHLLGPTTMAIVNEIEQRNIPWIRLDDYNLIQIGTGKFQQRIRATLTPRSSLLSVELSQDRAMTLKMLMDAGVKTLPFLLSASPHELKAFLNEHNSMCYLRPRFRKTEYARGCTVENQSSIDEILALNGDVNEEFLIQPYVNGQILRFLVVGDECIACASIQLPQIIGDGVSSVKQLVSKLNKQPGRQMGDKGLLSYVLIDKETKMLLAAAQLNEDSVLEEGRTFVVKSTPNPNNGSISEDVTHLVHPHLSAMALKAVHVVGLDVATVNMIVIDLLQSPYESDAFVTEIHAAPNFRMFLKPSTGEPTNVVKPFVDHVLKNQSKHHVPLIAVTGSKGKSLCCEILKNVLMAKGMNVGMSSSAGLFLAERKIKEGNPVEADYVRLLLKDPDIDVAIAEVPVENIIKHGLGYHLADFGVILNVHDNHINEIDISRSDDLAYAKSVVAEEVRPDGFAILNADDELVIEMTDRVVAKTAFISCSSQSPAVKKLIAAGKPVAISEQGKIHIYNVKDSVFEIDIFQTESECDSIVQAKTAACLVLLLMGVEVELVKQVL